MDNQNRIQWKELDNGAIRGTSDNFIFTISKRKFYISGEHSFLLEIHPRFKPFFFMYTHSIEKAKELSEETLRLP